MSDGDYQPKTPSREPLEEEELEIESSPIKLESITQYNKPVANKQHGTNKRPQIAKAKTANAAELTSANINWKGTNMQLACSQGNLPVVLTLWGLALPRNIDMMAPDEEGNTCVHYAALADNAEPLAFFLHETEKMPNINYLAMVNKCEQTPLLMAATTGNISVLKALLEGGSDPFSKDIIGSTVFINLAKGAHLWGLHYAYTYIAQAYGIEAATQLLAVRDKDNHGVLDWAAESGDVNVIEYLLRRGCSVAATDDQGRGPLYWAVFNHHSLAASYLTQAGCNPKQADNTGVTPLSVARSKGSAALVQAVSRSPTQTNIYFQVKQKFPSIVMTILYSLIMFFSWVVILTVPYYICIPVLACIGFGFYKSLESTQRSIKSRSQGTSEIEDTVTLTYTEYFLVAPERYLGLWLACAFITLLYLANCIDDDTVAGGFLEIGTNSSYSEHNDLFWFNAFMLLLSTLLWLYVVFLHRDPGIVSTRQDSFMKALDASLLTYGEPPSHLYCRTTLVEKPIRSKFCVRSGAVIARFDHYCDWLCNAIGAGNHRVFMLLGASHLILSLCMATMIISAIHEEFQGATQGTQLDTLFGRQYFFPLILATAYLVLAAALTFLLFDQCYNIGVNLTTNERINGHRYFYLLDEQNKFVNSFNRGVLSNIYEFLFDSSKYFTLMTAPQQQQGSEVLSKHNSFNAALDDDLTTATDQGGLETRSPLDHPV